MKNKDPQLRLFYPERLSFKIEGKMKSFPDQRKRVKGVHHQTKIAKNVKEAALRRRNREGEEHMYKE